MADVGPAPRPEAPGEHGTGTLPSAGGFVKNGHRVDGRADSGNGPRLRLRQVTPTNISRHSSEPGHGSASAAPPLDDANVEAAKRGEPSSWEAAYLAYGRGLMGYLMVRLENRDDAAEAVSETFARAIDRASSFRGDAYAFRAWLFTIARNVSTDQHRRRARLVTAPDQPESEDRSQPSGEEITILNDDIQQLRKGFSCLPKADQEILWLRICSGLSAADVGAVVGKRAGAVRMQQMRALDSLRRQVSL
ncbi:MAG TPA: sigma-70 family RNA polymerase sigma factor [Acidimicrobiales bacterium]|nr:sigma-70 family RNA polymerase sigma factor [Acidimicrobiales bacterium]